MPNLGDRVWHDADGDRLQDPGELGIAGVKLELGNLTTGVTVDMTTDANGNYLFEGLVNGQEYDLRIAASNFEEGGVLAGADITYKVGVMDGSHSVEFIMNNDADFFDFG
jgi:serine-aspartate repeat-containing protein C/D/E